MGSSISTLLYPLPTPEPSHLPLEIYYHILRYLNPLSADDRITLLNVSQCCMTLREVSQRILFRGLRPELQGRRSGSLDHILRIHVHFLYSIVDSPDRLARYVTHYSQDDLGVDPHLLVVGKLFIGSIFSGLVSDHLYREETRCVTLAPTLPLREADRTSPPVDGQPEALILFSTCSRSLHDFDP